MNTQELTQIVTAHQTAIARNETKLDRIEAILEATATQQQLNTQAIANLTAESQLSRQDINTLTASILELRNMVTDWMQRRD